MNTNAASRRLEFVLRSGLLVKSVAIQSPPDLKEYRFLSQQVPSVRVKRYQLKRLKLRRLIFLKVIINDCRRIFTVVKHQYTPGIFSQVIQLKVLISRDLNLQSSLDGRAALEGLQ